jgi:hypothetical protein
VRAISPKPVTGDNVVETLNKELIPLLRELRSAILSLQTTIAIIPPVALHAQTHEAGGSDELAGDLLDIVVSPLNYVPGGNELGLHLTGIDDALSPYLEYVPASASHVFVVADAFKTINCTHAAAVTHTIPLNLYPIGTVLRFLWSGTGQPTIATAGTLIAPDGAKVSALDKFAFAEQKALNTWLLSGSCAV